MEINLSNEIKKGLEEWAGEAHSSPFISFYLGLLAIQEGVEGQLSPTVIGMTRDELETIFRAGQPLFNLDKRQLDWGLVNGTFHEIAALFNSYPQVMGAVPQVMLSDAFVLPVEWARAWLSGAELPAEVGGEKLPPGLPGAIIQQTLRPFLIGYERAIAGTYDKDMWRRSYCPVCGSTADFGYLEKEGGALFLVCPTCCAEWLFQRTRCPYCGNMDNKTLSYYTDEDELYRLYLCDRCRSYLKTIDLRKTTARIIPALEALTTIDMDGRAQEMGYHLGEGRAETPE